VVRIAQWLAALCRRAGAFLGFFVALTMVVLTLPVSNALWATSLEASGTITMGVMIPSPPIGDEGCSLGFWKHAKHFVYWPTPYAPGTPFSQAFGQDVPDDPTLLEALKLEGGGLNALVRQAAAALLNAASLEVAFAYSVDQVKQMLQEALDSGFYEPTKDRFGQANEAGCPLPPPGDGTTLTAEKTAEGFRQKWIEYDWEIGEVQSPSGFELFPGESTSMSANAHVIRMLHGESNRVGVRGQICVTNTGREVTEGLAILDMVEFKLGDGEFQELTAWEVDVTDKAAINPGDRHCYPYQVPFVAINGAVYRNVARVSIDNFAGHHGEDYGTETSATFELPGSPTVVEMDGTADAELVSSCPEGFICTSDGASSWHLGDSGRLNISLVIRNVSAVCGRHGLGWEIWLKSSDSGQNDHSTSETAIDAGTCVVHEGPTVTPVPPASPMPTATSTSSSVSTPTMEATSTENSTPIP
jgi:hypothetical protein